MPSSMQAAATICPLKTVMTCVHVILGLLGLGPSNTDEETIEATIVFLTGFVKLLPDELQKGHGM